MIVCVKMGIKLSASSLFDKKKKKIKRGKKKGKKWFLVTIRTKIEDKTG